MAKCGHANILWQQINCTVRQLNVIIFNWQSSYGFLCLVMVKYSKIMEENLTTTECRDTKEDYHQPTTALKTENSCVIILFITTVKNGCDFTFPTISSGFISCIGSLFI